MSPETIAELRDLAGRAQSRWFVAAQSWSTKDRAEAYSHRLCQVFYEAIADGADVEKSLENADADWRKYADEQNAKIETAGKFQRGPYSGQSGKMDSYVYPDGFKNTAIHLRTMIKILTEKEVKSCPASE